MANKKNINNKKTKTKNKSPNDIKDLDQSKFDQNMVSPEISEVLKNNYMPYSMSVIVTRAIPEIDGFKPSHRKGLYMMYLSGLLTGNRSKSANVTGSVMKIHPHGNSSIYDTLVRLSKSNESLIVPYIDNKGSMGKHYSKDTKCAAERYTEMKLMPICKELFKDINKNAVDMVDNYDGTMKEPTYLPTTFPNILVNVNLGIAVGMASNICSFNFNEICMFTAEYMKNKKADIFEFIKGPDFATGGQLIFNKEEMKEIYETGRGSFKIRSKYYIDENHIIITEIPYTTTIEAIIDDIIVAVNKNKVIGIKDVRNECDLSGLKIAIELKKGINPDEIMQQLFSLTHLESSFGCNFNLLINKKPKVLGITQILDEWIEWRIKCIRNVYLYNIEKESEKLHLLKGLEKIILNIDKAIKIIRKTENDKEVIPNLIKSFKIDEIQATYVVDIKLRNLNKEFLLNKTKDIKIIEKNIEGMKNTINSDTKIKTIIKKELIELNKKYTYPRKTEIIDSSKIKTIKVKSTDKIEKNYPVLITLSEEGYFKKLKNDENKKININDIKTKDGDKIIKAIECDNESHCLVFTNKGNCYKLILSDIQNDTLSNLGNYLKTNLEFEYDEKIIDLFVTKTYKGNLIFVFKNGKIAKITLSSYETKTKRKQLINAFNISSDLINMFSITKNINLLIKTEDNRQIIINTSLINEKTTKSSQGVQCVRLNKTNILSCEEILEIEKNMKKYVSKTIPIAPKKI